MTEDELFELLLAYLPETVEGWLATGMAICAVLSVVLPEPKDEAHPLVKAGHRIICILGLGASKIRAAGKLGKLLKRGKA